ncbi:MAG: ribosome biogenesis GTPase YlqF [Oscillospiraceae bacterium]|nr:ribosome biogenesis GTPase YlqF [Oscillospiraceae bacterium]MDD7355344.1 ribosome biogenesis GTPase YlqF [Oscillospiraceae bacterium]MDY3937626.1 ribosome biogenesis GTPase YlqF [Oscillospiraceae bacterium]
MADQQKQIIQWFPGHMAKTRRLIKEQLKLVDAVTMILDARIPISSLNPEIDEITEGKPKIVLLNKADLADENATARWIKYYNSQGSSALAVDCRTGRGLNAFRPLVREVLKDKIKQNEDKGMKGKTLRIMVIGIPNTGKSSFVNKMGAGGKAKVEDRAGVTRNNQWFVIGGGIELLDTPGVLWPKFDDPEVGDRLAFTGGVKDQILDMEILVCRFLDMMKKNYPERLTERYNITSFEDAQSYEILEMIGRKRGMLISGGEVNTERAAIAILDEYRAGKLGRITFELPEDIVK